MEGGRLASTRMGAWNIAVMAAVIIAYAAVSARLQTTVVSSAIVFVSAGLLLGPTGLGWFESEMSADLLRVLAEVTLTFILFTDASRLDLRALRRDYPVPSRLLGIGLPLTIIAGALIAKAIWPDLLWAEAAVLAVILAPTDAALGQAVVTDPRLPTRISQGLNIESGLNDGICVPLLFIFLAAAGAEDGRLSGIEALHVVLEEIGFGVVGGVIAALIGVAAIHWGITRAAMSPEWVTRAGLATAALAYGIAAPLGGSGFIAAFVGGLVFAALGRRVIEGWSDLVDGAGGILDALTLFAFGAVVLGTVLRELDWQTALYAVLSLTVIRMVPVALALLGSHAQWPTIGFVGWFGPRGLASIVFVVVMLDDSDIAGAGRITLVSAATVGLSVYAHGLTAVPLSERYRRWYAHHPRPTSLMEHEPVSTHRWRWDRFRGGGPESE
jgi:sodium/hydrogen antiporter